MYPQKYPLALGFQWTVKTVLETLKSMFYILFALRWTLRDVLGRMLGGEGGIRTPDTVARMPHFECGAIDHSATSPILKTQGFYRGRGRQITPLLPDCYPFLFSARSIAALIA